MLHLLVAPLPDARRSWCSAISRPSAPTCERSATGWPRFGAARLAADAAIETLALEELHQLVEQAVRQLMAAILSAATPEAFQALSGPPRR